MSSESYKKVNEIQNHLFQQIPKPAKEKFTIESALQRGFKFLDNTTEQNKQYNSKLYEWIVSKKKEKDTQSQLYIQVENKSIHMYVQNAVLNVYYYNGNQCWEHILPISSTNENIWKEFKSISTHILDKKNDSYSCLFIQKQEGQRLSQNIAVLYHNTCVFNFLMAEYGMSCLTCETPLTGTNDYMSCKFCETNKQKYDEEFNISNQSVLSNNVRFVPSKKRPGTIIKYM
jgi:hypothetical protein